MLKYQLRLAWKSIRRTPLLSALTIGGIALGIGVSMSFLTMYYYIAGDPIPHKSDRLFYVQLDSWDPDSPANDAQPTEPPEQMTYMDAMALMDSDIPTRHAAMYKSTMVVHPPSEDQRPFENNVRLTFADFFAMFDVPFEYGGGWSAEADEGPAPEIVLTAELNDRVFGGENSVGRTLQIEDREFRVVGVMGNWKPAPKFYDTSNGQFNSVEGFFLPFHWGSELEIHTTGNTNNWSGYDSSVYANKLTSEACWVTFWAELDTDEQREEYLAYLDAYALQQRETGRFQRPLNNRARGVMEWLEQAEVVSSENTAMVIIAMLFLVICAINLIGILLGKFLARSPEIGVRRALGATRRWVFTQHLIECQVIGFCGALLGLVMANGGVMLIQRLFELELGAFTDWKMMLVAASLAAVASLIAGLYPAWRVCQTAPSVHLKTQ